MEFCADERMTCYDTYDALKRGGDVFVDGIHLNPKGCGLVAEYIAEIILPDKNDGENRIEEAPNPNNEAGR